MNVRWQIVEHIRSLVRAFKGLCDDASTLEKLEEYSGNRSRWKDCHSLFQHIRSKTLRAEDSGNRAEIAQYHFEEACAKSLYNLSQGPAPFDADSPYWIVPNAIVLGRQLEMSDEVVLGIITKDCTAGEV